MSPTKPPGPGTRGARADVVGSSFLCEDPLLRCGHGQPRCLHCPQAPPACVFASSQGSRAQHPTGSLNSHSGPWEQKLAARPSPGLPQPVPPAPAARCSLLGTYQPQPARRAGQRYATDVRAAQGHRRSGVRAPASPTARPQQGPGQQGHRSRDEQVPAVNGGGTPVRTTPPTARRDSPQHPESRLLGGFQGGRRPTPPVCPP